MPWSPVQQKLAVKAAALAGWKNEQRYLAMRHVGCALLHSRLPTAHSRPPAPSVKHPANTQTQYELYMAIAESAAAQREKLDTFPRPHPGSGATSWGELTQRRTSNEIRLINHIATEASERLSNKFAPGFLIGFITRMTRDDAPEYCGNMHKPVSLDECDEAQLYRILEGLKSWVGREMIARDMRPRNDTWTIPANAWAQMRERAAGHSPRRRRDTEVAA